MEQITIDVVSDVACPWCFVGKRRLEAAIREWKGIPIKVIWHPLQLNPEVPPEGIDRAAYLQQKFGNRVDELLENLVSVGKQVGISYNFEKQKFTINTLPLHILLHQAKKEGFQNELKEKLLSAYFENGTVLNSIDSLYKLLSEFGWDSKKVLDVLSDKDLEKEVKTEIEFFKNQGISGVPFFIINNTYSISGAQTSNVFLEVFNKVAPSNSKSIDFNSVSLQ